MCMHSSAIFLRSIGEKFARLLYISGALRIYFQSLAAPFVSRPVAVNGRAAVLSFPYQKKKKKLQYYILKN